MVHTLTLKTKKEAGIAAGNKAAELLKKIIMAKRYARFVAATGVSQLEFLASLCNQEGVEWQKTTMFHLDEYIGITHDHRASFRKFLIEHLIRVVSPGTVHLIKGETGDPQKECDRLNEIVKEEPIDVAFVGIGENAHLAFNDPPADFTEDNPYIIVKLDDACRQQQVNEGWFASIGDVPSKAITISITQIIKARYIICTCPEKRKAESVRNCLSPKSRITPKYPASILKKHDDAYCFLDKASASRLNSL
jgi:glucosamine-6-phosphate deaminase